MYRLRQLWPEYKGRLRIAWKALSLELKNEKPTPKDIVDQENELMAEQDPSLPVGPWRAPEWTYPATVLPAFEAIECASLQGDDAAWELSWAVRKAFFNDSRCISMRHVLVELARESGLDVQRFGRAWDEGGRRPQVVGESHHGWEELKVLCSPTFVLRSGWQEPNPGAWKITWGPGRRIAEVNRAVRPWQEVYEELLDRALSEG